MVDPEDTPAWLWLAIAIAAATLTAVWAASVIA